MKIFIFALLLTCATVPDSYGETAIFDGDEGEQYEGVLVPDAFGELLAMQISHMYQEKYFDCLSKRDFFHGHLVFRVGSPEAFVSFEDMLKYVALTLYHTDESTTVWDHEGPLDPGARRQRSIVGLKDGGVRPAIELFSVPYEKFDHYIVHGSIHVTEFGWLMPKQFEQDRSIRIASGAEWQWFTNQFRLYKTLTGRYEVSGIRYDIYLETMP